MMNSDEGALVTSTELEDPYYAFWQADGMEYSFTVTGKTLSYAYLYFGDGTGQYVSADNVYAHTTGLNCDFIPALIVVYTDSTSEELLCPLAVETFLSTEVFSPRPTSFTPPTTGSSTVNNYLSNNGHTCNPVANFICICGLHTSNCGKRYIQGVSECKQNGICTEVLCA
ncbi:hypothetical protein J7K50_08620 [bacterium]|nr:hypothetical protein [bacterium]